MIDTWTGCYPSNWVGKVTPETMSHPAKFSSRLIERIYSHAIEEGWLHEGSIVCDPFGGVGLGALEAMRHGMVWVGVELEPRFATLAQANFDLWNSRYSGRLPHWGSARIIQGDSRRFAEIVREAGLVISSPPYADQDKGYGDRPNRWEKVQDNPNFKGRTHWKNNDRPSDYGATPGNLGNMPAEQVDSVIASPPYSESNINPGNVGNQIYNRWGQGRSLTDHNDGYGFTPGQLGAMPAGDVDAIVASPPYEATLLSGGGGIANEVRNTYRDGQNYGDTNGQLGADSGDTFWRAARTILEQVYQVLSPGGHAIWVVKGYVKNKKLVDFPGQWRSLCEAVGFVTLHEHHAMLVKHNGTSLTLDGEKIEHITESKSFFRRLAEKKGSPKIDYETVYCMVKPGEGDGMNVISSPPFSGSTADGGWQMLGKYAEQGKLTVKQVGGDLNKSYPSWNKNRQTPYADSPGNLGNLPPGNVEDVTK